MINHYPKSKSFDNKNIFDKLLFDIKYKYISFWSHCVMWLFFWFWEQCVKWHYIVSYMKYPGVGCCDRILPQTILSSSPWGWGGEGGSTRSQHHDLVMKYSLCVGTCKTLCEHVCTKVSTELFFSWILFLFLI
jgi:hypothetical protein